MRVFHTHAALSGRLMLVMSHRREKCNFFLHVVENLLIPADFLCFCWQSFAFTGGQIKCPLFHRGITVDVR